MHLFYQYLIVFCFNLVFALPASSMELSGCNSTQVVLSIFKKVVQACYHNLDKCTNGETVLEGRFLLYTIKESA